MQPQLTWDIGADITELLRFPFMIHAYQAGTVVAVVTALCGWFMVLRRQTFAGHTLALVGFPGAAGAVLLAGLGAAPYGYFASSVAAAAVIALLPRGAQRAFSEESALTGVVQAFGLACGFLFINLYHGSLSGAVAPLFGFSIVAVTADQVVALLAGGLVVVAVLAVIGRPLLFATVDPRVAAARGVPVALLSVVFLVLLGVAAAEADQITGALLVFALLVLPAATAQSVTDRPLVSVPLSVALGVGVTWLGLACAYYSPYPAGFWVSSLAFAVFAIVRLARVLRVRPRPRSVPA